MKTFSLTFGMRVGCLLVPLCIAATGCSKDTTINAAGAGDDASVAPELPDCPEGVHAPGTHGPSMLRVARTDGTCFWIDKTEVTRAQYAQFLASNPAVQVESPCDSNDSYEPSCAPLDEDAGADASTGCPEDGSLPVVCVDWCDAAAFCGWAGKALCKGDYDAAADAATSSWYAACSHGDDNVYPYGDEYDPTTCFGLDFSSGAETCPRPAGDLVSCATPEGVLDMSGNIGEWVDECKNPGAETGECRYRGGYFAATGDRMSCETALSELMMPQMKLGKLQGRRPYIGFRCCAYDL